MPKTCKFCEVNPLSEEAFMSLFFFAAGHRAYELRLPSGLDKVVDIQRGVFFIAQLRSAFNLPINIAPYHRQHELLKSLNALRVSRPVWLTDVEAWCWTSYVNDLIGGLGGQLASMFRVPTLVKRLSLWVNGGKLWYLCWMCLSTKCECKFLQEQLQFVQCERISTDKTTDNRKTD